MSSPLGGLPLLAVLTGVYFGFIGYFHPYLPLWLHELGFGTLAIGALVSMHSVTRVVAPYAWGWLADHTGRRERLMRLAATGALLAALVLLAFPGLLSPSLLVVGAVLFAMFLHTSALMPMAEAAVAQQVSSSQGLDLRRYGRVRVWGSVGYIVTVVASGFWFERHGMGAFALFTVGLLLLLVLVCWRLPVAVDDGMPPSPAPSAWPVLRRPAVRWLFISAFFMVLAHIALYAFLSLYLDALGYSKRVVGGLWAVSILMEIAFFLRQGRWLARGHLAGWMTLACAVAAVRFGATAAFGASLAVLIVAQAAHALTFAAHHTACVALINRHFDGRLRGRGQALYAVIGYGISGVVGAVGGGALASVAGFASVFWAASAAAVLATLAGWRAWRLDRPDPR